MEMATVAPCLKCTFCYYLVSLVHQELPRNVFCCVSLLHHSIAPIMISLPAGRSAPPNFTIQVIWPPFVQLLWPPGRSTASGIGFTTLFLTCDELAGYISLLISHWSNCFSLDNQTPFPNRAGTEYKLVREPLFERSL